MSNPARTLFLVAAVAVALAVAVAVPVRYLGLLGVLGIAGATAGLLATAVHPLAPFSLYFGALSFAETPIPGFPVTANQVLALLFLASFASFWWRGHAMSIRSAFLPVLAVVAVYFTISAATGGSFERGIIHARYVVIYFALAYCIAASLGTERSILAFAWIVTGVTVLSAMDGLLEAFEKNTFMAFAGKISDAVRVKGTAKNAIVYAWNLAYAFPFAFFLFSETRTQALRVLGLLAGFFILFIAALGLNRQTYIIITVQVALCAMLFAYRNRRTFLAVLGGVAVIGAATMTPVAVARLSTLGTLGRDTSFLERRDAFLMGYEMFKAHPITGVGLGSFPAVWKEYIPPDYSTYFAQYLEPQRVRYPDVGYMQLVAETGIIGTALFLLLLATLFRLAWRMRVRATQAGDRFALNLASLVLVLGCHVAITTFIQDTFLYVRVWILFALTLLMDERVLPVNRNPEEGRPPGGTA